MSQRLVSLNSDLRQLRDEGLDISVTKSRCLLIRGVPYVSAAKEVKYGTLASVLDLAGETTVPPQTHVVYFVGEPPCDEHGTLLPGVSPNTNHALGEGLNLNHSISRVPKTGPNAGKYPNYYEKIRTLVAIVSSPAQQLDNTVRADTWPVVLPDDDDESVFNYFDTAATKSGIVEANRKLEGQKVAIVGVGGTGSYVLDFVAKTPVAEIHIFDHDIFLNHNAFRCPGAPSLAELSKKQMKVSYLADIYSRMRKKIIPHDHFIDENTVEELREMNFVFVCIDKGTAKRLLVERLQEWGAAFVDVGMGIQLGDDNTLGGIITVTTSTPNKRDHVPNRIAFSDGEAANEYSNDVQISELSALNAALAVVKWKKHCGYYDDVTKEHYCAYTIRTNQLISEDYL